MESRIVPGPIVGYFNSEAISVLMQQNCSTEVNVILS